MNIEHMKAAVESILECEIDPTVWDRFAGCGDWDYEVKELLAELFERAEADIIETLSEIDAEEAEIEL